MLQMPHTCTGFLIVFIFSTGVVNAEPDAVHRRAKRNSFQFGSMVEHTTGRDPLDFIDYGCYCGLGGFGTPVDGLDECCKKHDKCWTKVGLKDSSCNFLGGVWTTYDYKITKRGKIKCKDDRGSCERGFCQCDKKAAMCFANQPYLDEHYDIDLDIC